MPAIPAPHTTMSAVERILLRERTGQGNPGPAQVDSPVVWPLRATGGNFRHMTAPPESVPTTLATALAERYTIERELGRGGMARVYLAHDVRHDRDVAIKVMDPQLSVMIGADRFLREIQITAQLTHPNIIPLLDSGQAQGGGLLYYVTPYAPDESLRSRLTRASQLPLRDALRITR